MEEQSKRKVPLACRRFMPWFILVPALVALVCMTVAFQTQYDAPVANYFKRGAILPSVACIFAGISAILGVVWGILMPKGKIPSSSLPFGRASFVSATGYLFCGFFIVLGLVKNNFSDSQFGLKIAVLVFALISVAYTLAVSFCDPEQESVKKLLIWLGFAPIICHILLCAVLYFDASVEMNASMKVLSLVGLLFTMILYTGELRFHTGKPMPKFYIVLLSWAVAFGGMCAIAISGACLTGKINLAEYSAVSYAVDGCFVSSAIRLALLPLMTED